MSYGNSSGGTLTLPSPNGVHHVDVSAAVRSLRRSLSRSPSKLNLTRAYSQSSDSAFSTPGSPSPCRIIQRPMPPASAPHLSHQHSQSNLSTPFRSAVKLSLRSGKPKAASAKPLSRAARVSPRSPVKRALSNTTDSGNSLSSPSPSPPTAEPLFGQENHITGDFSLPLSPTSRKTCEKQHSARHSMHLDVSGGFKNSNTFPRLFDFKADPIPSNSVSPLKRSDVFLNSGQASVDSPVAKRRSLHGIPGTPISEPDVFDATSSTPQNFEIHEDNHKDFELGAGSPSFDENEPTSPTPITMPRRTDSLRRSTLQQRQGEKSSWGRRQGEKQLAQMGAGATSPMVRNTGRPRVSLDQFVQPALPRDSPFSAQSPLPNPSLHLLDRPHLQAQPHPLSRSVTTSSSNSSLADESPTHIPVQFEKPRAHPFAKSMPVGARPLFENTNKNAATPAYKNAKPFQEAFKSTGLISKVNRNPELEQSHFGESKAVMPDTPCKKPIYPSSTYPPSSGGGKARHRHSFGSPSSPFALGGKDSFSFGEPEKASSLFKSFQPSQSNHVRKMSSLFSDIDTQNLDDTDEFPPTPTRSVFFRSVGNSKTVGDSPFVKTTAPATVSSLNFRDVHQIPDPLCKSASFNYPPKSTGFGDLKPTHVETAYRHGALNYDLSPPMPESFSTFKRSRAGCGSHAIPEPLNIHSTTPILSNPKRVLFAKPALVTTASPLASLDKFVANNSPKTPRDNTSLMPPDPSSLSISNHHTPNGATLGGSFPPATPTSRIEQFGGFADRRMSITPVNGGGPSDIDMVLNSRFEHVELVGKGEFSQVFKVTQTLDSNTATTPIGTPGTPPTPSQARVFAVKKTRLPFFGAKDREAKLREVRILESLRSRPHVLQYVDSWEKQFHLYIQTEYCEEGNLSGFLGNVGSAGRLDDFRIWKILSEASMASQHFSTSLYKLLTYNFRVFKASTKLELSIWTSSLPTFWSITKVS